ncbi:hypothetical protein, partial [Conservatibacter flavescens]
MTDRVITTGIAEPIENNSYTIHVEDAYFLVLGFEVNKSPLTNPNFEEDMKKKQIEIKRKAKQIEETNKREGRSDPIPTFDMPKGVYSSVTFVDDHDSNITAETMFHRAQEDPGHTFMYLVKGERATTFFSFGPLVSDPHRLEEYIESQPPPDPISIYIQTSAVVPYRPQDMFKGINMGEANRIRGLGTPDYRIPEKTFLFKKKISEEAYHQIKAQAEKNRAEIISGSKYYNVILNNTCAEEVRNDVIGDAIPDLPYGRSRAVLTAVEAINPYAFYDQMKQYAAKTRYIGEFV